MAETRFTFCRLCEATCGLQVEIEDERIRSIRPDSEHVVSRGYAYGTGTCDTIDEFRVNEDM